jgi:hypothetical protein
MLVLVARVPYVTYLPGLATWFLILKIAFM